MKRFSCSIKSRLTGVLLGFVFLFSLVSLSGCAAGGERKNDSGGSSNKSSEGKSGSNSSGVINAGSDSNTNSSTGGADDVFISRNSVFFYDGTDAFLVGLAGKEIYTVPKEDKESFSATVSLYGDKAIIHESYGKCYYFDGNAPVLIEEEASDPVISPDGSSCAYGKYDEEGAFHLYRYSNGVSQPVTFDENKHCDCFLLSFDGKYVGYSVIDEDGKNHSYLWDNDIIDLGTDCYILAVSANADFIYYSTDNLGERDFYIQSGLNSDQKVLVDHCGYSREPAMYFNYDGTEMLIDAYSTSDKVYIKGEPCASFFGFPFFLDQTIVIDNSNFSADITITNVRTLSNVIASIFDSPYISFYFIGEDGKLEAFAEDVYYAGARIVNGNHEIICRVEDRIVKYTEKKGKVQQETLISQNANDLFVAQDGSRFFYLDEGGALYYVEGSKKPVLAAEAGDESSYGVYVLGGRVFDNRYLYYSVNGEMFVTDGSKAEKLGGLFENLKELHIGSCFVWIITELDNEEHVFVSRDGVSFMQME